MFDFDEIEVRDEFISHLKEVFKNEYDLIGSEVEVLPRESQEPTYPCCIVRILNPISNENYSDSDGSYKYLTLSLNCDLYSTIINNFSLEDSVIKLKQILIKGILKKYRNLVVTRDNDVPFMTDVHRRNVVFRFTYDNENKIIYSN